jgi:hypothetical protein
MSEKLTCPNCQKSNAYHTGRDKDENKCRDCGVIWNESAPWIKRIRALEADNERLRPTPEIVTTLFNLIESQETEWAGVPWPQSWANFKAWVAAIARKNDE